jgi:hypothetical protein
MGSVSELDDGVAGRDCRQDDLVPSPFNQHAGQVVLVRTLGHDEDLATGLEIEARYQHAGEPMFGVISGVFRIGVVGLQGIVDNDSVSAVTDQLAPTEVAMRNPPDVVMSSPSVTLDSRVWGNSRR